MNTRRVILRLTLLGLAATLLACGSKPSTTPDPPTSANTITITAAGVSPKTMQIAIGTRVLFVNSDSRSHRMSSDPHPEHTDCPALEQVGFLSTGQSRESGNFVEARSCGFHDHDMPLVTSLQGTITVK